MTWPVADKGTHEEGRGRGLLVRLEWVCVWRQECSSTPSTKPPRRAGSSMSRARPGARTASLGGAPGDAATRTVDHRSTSTDVSGQSRR